ncbi:hypothetical protein [Noviherbaspirillum sedimenti]|uniref:hypothetical protein n=1 Tax=Noviherbaspirillum sedimenti TaxID=2320865 RepID=UPI001F15EB7D|nr:hypothetical protein [Noviherbaspirillum sedimenti]
MSLHNLIGQRLLALFMLGWLLFNYPLLALFGSGENWFGLPATYVYLFAVWALLIALMAWVAEHRQDRQQRTAQPDQMDDANAAGAPGAVD